MIFLGIGSNLSSSFGDRFKNIDLAISFLETYKINIIKKSSFYETFSYPNKSNPKFINSVIAVETKLSPVDLMSVLIFVEEKLERKRSKKNDRDLELTLPHKEMTNRNFVLYPLREIYPNWIHPLTKKNIDVLIKDLKTSNNEITKLF